MGLRLGEPVPWRAPSPDWPGGLAIRTGALGLLWPLAEVCAWGDGWLRWVHVGQRTPWGRFVQVFTSLALGADGQPHYGNGAGVWQVRAG